MFRTLFGSARRYCVPRVGLVIALLGSVAPVAMFAAQPALASGSRQPVLVTRSEVGPLRLDVSGPNAVYRFAGFPQSVGSHALQYRCSFTTHACRINFFFGRVGTEANRFVAAVIAARGFQTRGGTTIGMSKARAIRLEHGAVMTNLCGTPVLRRPAFGSTSNTPNAGLNVLFHRGKVASFVIVSTHAQIACAGVGFYYVLVAP
jgi:hypothetical protein